VKEGRAESLCFVFLDDLDNWIVVVMTMVFFVVVVVVVWLRPTDVMTLWLWLRLWLRLSPMAMAIFVASGDVIGGRV